MTSKTTEIRPDPLVDNSVDLRSFPFMPLHVLRVLSSDFHTLSTGDEFKAGFSLWLSSWHQVPAGSIPNNEKWLAKYSCAGNVEDWRKVQENALRNFIECSDGRLYHIVISEIALNTWNKSKSDAQRTQAATQARRVRDMKRNGDRHVNNNDQRNVQQSADTKQRDEILSAENKNHDDQRHVQESYDETQRDVHQQNLTKQPRRSALSDPNCGQPVDNFFERLQFERPWATPEIRESLVRIAFEAFPKNPGSAQEVLDQLASRTEKKPKSPAGLLRKIIGDYLAQPPGTPLPGAALVQVQREAAQVSYNALRAGIDADDNRFTDPPVHAAAIIPPFPGYDGEQSPVPDGWWLEPRQVLRIGAEHGVDAIPNEDFEAYTARVIVTIGYPTQGMPDEILDRVAQVV